MIEADRQLVESDAHVILEDAKDEVIVLLVVGDPFGATTHVDLLLRARELNIETQIIHNTSIINAIGCTGLQVSYYLITRIYLYFTNLFKLLFLDLFIFKK